MAGRCYHHAVASAALKKQLLGERMTAEETADEFSSSWERELGSKLVYDELEEEKVAAPVVDFGSDDPGKLKDSGTALAQLYVATVLPTLEVAYVENRLTADIDGVPFIGFLDLELAGGTVVDHKLRQRMMSAEEIERDIQASSYAVLKGKPISFQFHQALDTKERRIEIAETAREERDIEWMKDLARECWAMIQGGIFPPNPLSWTCSAANCPYFLDCRKGWF